MTSLVAVIGDSAGTRAHVAKLIDEQEFDSICVIGEPSYREQFQPKKQFDFIPLDANEPLPEMTERIRQALGKKRLGVEVAVNFISGTGKEHMALLAALLKLGLGIRFVAMTKEGVKEI